jgi:hypothetical protein
MWLPWPTTIDNQIIGKPAPETGKRHMGRQRSLTRCLRFHSRTLACPSISASPCLSNDGIRIPRATTFPT